MDSDKYTDNTPPEGSFRPGSRNSDPQRRDRKRYLIPAIVTLFLLACVGSLAATAALAFTFFRQGSSPAPPVRISVQGRKTPPPKSSPATPAIASLTDTGAAEPTAFSCRTPQTLHDIVVPTRDMRDLALRLRPDVTSIPQTAPAPEYAVGDRIPFWVSNVDNNERFQIEGELFYKNEVVYIWVEAGKDFELDAMIQSADNFARKTYPLVRAFFGTEWNPGIDEDERLHILHATGLGQSIAGYFSSADAFSSLANAFSNQKEMFYISLEWLNRSNNYEAYETVLAHEFQHMVHWYNDRNEETWVNEGMSELAQEVVGYPPDMGFAHVYASQPDTQLNTWNIDQADNGRHYGGAYLFMAYFLQRFGEELTRSVVAQPANGIQGFTAALQEAGLDFTFEDVFADWVVANYANDYDALGVQGIYGYRQLQAPEPILEEAFQLYPQEATAASVRNFGVDYIALRGSGNVTVQFQGSVSTRFANVLPYSGDFAWWSNRADDSDMRLTRAFDFSDLRAADELTMNVHMWYDIEEDYDYGYVLGSLDGRKWDILTGQRPTAENPSGNSFGHAYTAKSATTADSETAQWVLESFDLRAYAGQEALVRFEYVTDDAVNAPGWFIDDITIPAIGYAADFENGADGWESEGWLLTDNRLPQEWLVQILVLADGELVSAERAPVGADGATRIDVEGLGRGNEVVLAISGQTPVTTEEALYEYRIEQR